jgi:hypothetical protein
MANAYYFAAHFNMPRPHALETSALNIFKPTSTTTAIPSQGTTSAHSTPIPTSSQSTSPFFRLPAELRNQIYEELLCASTPRSKDLPTHHYCSSRTPSVYPDIMSTCKRIHDEATDLLYTTHIFHAHPSLLTAMPYLLSPGKPVLNAEGLKKIKRWQLTLRSRLRRLFRGRSIWK